MENFFEPFLLVALELKQFKFFIKLIACKLVIRNN